MKITVGLGFALAAVALAHRGHMHAHEKKDVVKKDVVTEQVQITVVECWLGGETISEADCDAGIKNGTLKWADDGSLSLAATTSVVYHTSIPSPSPSSSSVKAISPSPSSAKASTTAVAAPPAKAAAPSQAAASSSSSSSTSGVTAPFPDGQIDCGTFPSAYGALAVDWLNLGGWASVQKPNIQTFLGLDDITSVTQAQCTGSTCCLEGSYCSYACPEGYLKYQWPTMQGATGQSVGGLLCQNGKLHLTNPSVKTLCAPGAPEVKVMVQNKLSQNVAICRTNYPGDEKMSIPVDAQPGTTRALACPDASTFYTWEGKVTSAQYYINMPGYSIEKACVWGDQGDDFGNFAPGNLGVGWSNGAAWLSITANHPTQTVAKLPYTIELIGGNSKCRYQNGQYCSGDDYGTCSTEGCTVSASGGTVTYVIS